MIAPASSTAGPPEDDRVVARERPELLILCGVLGLVGTLAPAVAIVWATAIQQHDIVADTISDLARGPHRFVMDTGFYLCAVGLLSLAIAASHAHLGRAAWSAGIFVLALAALNVVLLGVWDEFGQNVEGEGLSVHTWLSFGLGPLFLAGPLLMARAAARVSRLAGGFLVAAAVLWIVFATAFKFAPDAYDGLLEKIAVTMTWLWLLPLSAIFVARGRARL